MSDGGHFLAWIQMNHLASHGINNGEERRLVAARRSRAHLLGKIDFRSRSALRVTHLDRLLTRVIWVPSDKVCTCVVIISAVKGLSVAPCSTRNMTAPVPIEPP